MKRLYKFFFFLFIILLAISVALTLLLSLGFVQALQNRIQAEHLQWETGLPELIPLVLVRALLYSSALLLIIIFLLKKSLSYQQRFTVRKIVVTSAWFFFLILILYGIFYLQYPNKLLLEPLSKPLGPAILLPPVLWWPLPVAWLSLYFIASATIKNNDE